MQPISSWTRRGGASELSLQLNEELDAVRRERVEIDELRRNLIAKDEQLRRVAATLAHNTAEFDRRVITYDALAHELRLLKVDLRNIALAVDRSDVRIADASQLQVILVKQRDELGRAFLDEIHAAIRKAITASNFPASKAGWKPRSVVSKRMMPEPRKPTGDD